MKVLLVLNRENLKDARFLVRLQTSDLVDRVVSLLEKNQGKEAFDLMLTEAEISAYLPPGRRSPERPSMILIEDML